MIIQKVDKLGVSQAFLQQLLVAVCVICRCPLQDMVRHSVCPSKLDSREIFYIRADRDKKVSLFAVHSALVAAGPATIKG